MKIAIDARMIKSSGIGVYIQKLMENGCYNIALGKKEEIENVSKNVKIIDYDSKIYGIKEQLKFPYRKLKKEKIDILHVPHYNIPIFYRGKMVVTIHDLTHLIYPEFLPNKFAYLYAKFMLWLATKKAYKILTVSENTKKDILKFFKVDPDKIKVIYNAVGEEFVEKNKEELEYLYDKFKIPKSKKIILYVGNLKPHKNLERLLEAYSRIDNKEDTCLILVGKAFANYNVLEDREKQLQIEKNVIHTGVVTQEELVDLYNLADVFVFPSLYEGFGLPVLEALACGTPVICSNTSSIPEVGGNEVTYINPLDVEDITEKLLNSNKQNINKDSVKKHLAKYTWKKTYEKTWEEIAKDEEKN